MKKILGFAFAIVTTLVFVICLYAAGLPYGLPPASSDNLIDFSHNWHQENSLDEVSIDGASYDKGFDNITFTKKLPENLPNDAVLFLRSNHNEISCYVGERELFCEGVCRGRTFGISYVGIWIIVPIADEYSGQTITMNIKKSDGNTGQLPEEIIIANRNQLTHFLAKQLNLPTLIAFFMIALSLAMLIAAHLLKRHNNNQIYNSVLWLSLFIFMSGIWMIMDDNSPALFMQYNDAFYFLSFYSFMLMPVPFTRFIGECIPKSQKAMSALSVGFILAVLMSMFSAIFFAKPLSFMLPITHILIFIGFLAILFYVCNDKNAQGKPNIPELFWGLIMFISAAGSALIFFYLGAIRAYALLFRIATLLFVLALSLGTIRRSISEIERARSFEQLAQFIPSGISRLSCSEGFPILYGNETYYKMFGYTPQQAQSIGFVNFDFMLLPEDRERLFHELTMHVKEKHSYFEIETRARHKSGDLMYMLTTNNFIPETNELISVLTNITLRKTMEDKLRIQELEFRIASEQSEKYIMRYEVKTYRLYTHSKCSKVFGIPEICENAEQTLKDLQFISPGSLEKHAEIFVKIHRGDSIGSTVMQMFSKEHSALRWYHFDFTNIFDKENKPEQTIISFYDITEQREKKLAYDRLKLDAASAEDEQITTFSCNLIQDAISESSGKLLANLSSVQSFDARTEEYFIWTHPDDVQSLKKLMNRNNLIQMFKSSILSHSLEFRMFIDGKYRWLKLRI